MQARAEIARAYLTAGDIDTARRQLDIVRAQPNIPPEVRDVMIDLVAKIDLINRGGGTLWNGYIEGGGGYDSNVNTATSDSTLFIPLFAGFGTARLTEDARERSSVFLRQTGHAALSHGISRRWRLFGNVTGAATQYASAHDFDQIDLTGRVGGTFITAKRNILSADITAQQTTLNHSLYRWMVGPSFSYERKFLTSWRLGSYAQLFDIRYPETPGRDGMRYTFGAGMNRTIPFFWGATLSLSAYNGGETVSSSSWGHLAYEFTGARGGIETSPTSDLATFFTLSAERRGYLNGDPLFLTVRDDRQFDAVIGAVYRIDDSWSMRGQAGYTYNDSNIALYEYDRWSTAAYLRYGF